MADAEDKEKAEKLAAAKKRFEQLKKQKGKKGAAKKKDDKSEDMATDDKGDTGAEEATGTKDEPEDKPDAETTTVDDAKDDSADVNTDEKKDDDKPGIIRQPSLSAQSRQRSESFRKQSTVVSPGLKSPGSSPLDSELEVKEVYRKQAAKIEELEKENKALKDSQDEIAAKLSQREEELERLREDSGQMAELKSKASLVDEKTKEIETLNQELASVQRQLTQAQQSAASKRRQSVASPANDLSEQLASKTSTIESLELELSNLRNQVSILESDKTSHSTTISSLEAKLKSAEDSNLSAQEELEKLKATMSAPESDAAKSPETDVTSLNLKISVLQSDLRTAQTAADTALARATSFEQKIEALTKLHRDATATTATRDKEIKDLKSRLKSMTATTREAGGEDLSDLEDEEREKLHARIRDLEAETFELRRGVWRDKRTALQPGMDNDTQPTSPYDEIDLSGGASPYGSSAPGLPRQTSTFNDVLQSGINAFTGRERPRAQSKVDRRQSLGLLSEDGFDEGAFAAAQEEEAKRRVERVKDIKRGLEKWRGNRLELAPNPNLGPVFEA